MEKWDTIEQEALTLFTSLTDIDDPKSVENRLLQIDSLLIDAKYQDMVIISALINAKHTLNQTPIDKQKIAILFFQLAALLGLTHHAKSQVIAQKVITESILIYIEKETTRKTKRMVGLQKHALPHKVLKLQSKHLAEELWENAIEKKWHPITVATNIQSQLIEFYKNHTNHLAQIKDHIPNKAQLEKNEFYSTIYNCIDNKDPKKSLAVETIKKWIMEDAPPEMKNKRGPIPK